MKSKVLYGLASFLLILNMIVSVLGFSTTASAAEDATTHITDFKLTVKENGVEKNPQVVTKPTDQIFANYKFEFDNKTETYTFKLPNQIKMTAPITNQELAGGVGNFSIDASGNVTLNIKQTGTGAKLPVEFEAFSTINPDHPFTDGDTVIKQGSQEATLKVAFAKGAPIHKTAKADGNKVTWTIDVNTSLSQLTNAKLVDTLPVGFTVEKVTVKDLGVKLNANESVTLQEGNVSTITASTSGSTVTVDFGNTSKAYRVIIESKRTDTALIANYENTATLTATGMDEQKSTAKVTFKDNVEMKKEGTLNEANKTISYEVTINSEGKSLPAGIFYEDTLKANILDSNFKVKTLDASAIEVYKADGTTPVPTSDYTVNVSTNNAKEKVFTITFNKAFSEMYKIKYNVAYEHPATTITNGYENGRDINNTGKLYVDNTKTAELSTATSTVKPSLEGRQFFIKTSKVDYANKEIKYTINVPVTEDGKKVKVVDWPASSLLDLTEIDWNEKKSTDNFNKTFKDYKVVKDGNVVPDLKGAELEITDKDGFRSHLYLHDENGTTDKGQYTITYTLPLQPDYQDGKYTQNNALLYYDNTLISSQYINNAIFYNEWALANGYKKGQLIKDETGASTGVKYEAGINYNRHDLTGATLKDTLTGSQSYKQGTFKLYKWTLNTAGDETNAAKTEITGLTWNEANGFKLNAKSFELDFDKFLTQVTNPEKSTDAYVIEYETTIDPQVEVEKVKNAIQVDYNEAIENSMDSSKNQPIVEVTTIPRGGEHVTKEGVQNGRLANWVVDINATYSELSNVVVSDELTTGHKVVASSFELYAAQLNGDNILESTGEQLVEGKDYTLTFTENGFKLAFKSNIDRPYVLKYNSYITGKPGAVVANKVKITSDEEVKSQTESSDNFAISGASGSGYPANGIETTDLQIKKVDSTDDTKVLPGAEFELMFKDQSTNPETITIRTAATDENGIATFKDIPLTSEELQISAVTLKETKAPEGYQLDEEAKELTIKANMEPVVVTNKPTKASTGTLELTKVDSEATATTLPGATFTITGPDDYSETVTSDTNGKIELKDLAPGEYTITETKAPAGYELNNKPIKVEVVAGETTQQDIQNTLKPTEGNLTITKVDSEVTTTVLAEAEFTITGPNGYEQQATSSASGKIVLTGLAPGEYTITETKAPAGYELNKEPVKVTVEAGKTAEKDIQNVRIPQVTSLIIQKVDAVSNVVLAGAAFNITGPNNFNTTVVTDASGKITLNDVAPGEYTITETKAPNGYKLNAEPTKVTVTAETTVTTTIKNTKDDTPVITPPVSPTGELVIKKVDAATKESLQGAVFTITGPNDYNKEFTTDANGQIKIPNLQVGSYTIKEKTAPAGYDLVAQSVTVDIAANGSVEKVIENKKTVPQAGSIVITKVDSADKKALAGAAFVITGPNEFTQTVTTDASGKIEVKDLPYGEYTITEKTAPAGYVLLTEAIKVDVQTNDPVLKTIENKKASTAVGGLEITKVDSANLSKKLPGAVFTIIGPNDYSETMTTDASGKIELKDLPVGDYQIVEVEAPAGYEMTSLGLTVTVTENNVSKETVTNDKITTIETGAVTLTKYDIDSGKTLKGATFDLLDADGEVIEAGLKTDANGELTVEGLDFGDYAFVETKAPKNYVLDDSEIPFTIDSEMVYVEAYNALDESDDDGSDNDNNPSDGGNGSNNNGTDTGNSGSNNAGSGTSTNGPSTNGSSQNGTSAGSNGPSTFSTNGVNGSTGSNGAPGANGATGTPGMSYGTNSSNTYLPQTGENMAAWTTAGVMILLLGGTLLFFGRKKRMSN